MIATLLLGSCFLLTPFPHSAHAASPTIRPQVVAQALIESGDVGVFAPLDQLNFTQSRMTRVDELTIISIPITKLHPGSNVSIALKGGSIQQVVESHFSTVSAGSGLARVWRDGRVIVDGLFSVSSPSGRGVYLDGGSGRTQGFSLDKVNRCLSNAGVPAWLVAAAGFACGIPEPATKIICIIGLGIGAGTLSFCVRYAFDDRVR